MKSPPNFHLAAAQAVMRVVDDAARLDAVLQATPPGRRARMQEICYGACRHYHRLDAALAQWLPKPLKRHDRVVHFLLVNGCYHITHMRTPVYAAVNESVAAVKGTRFAWAGGMINAVLRNYAAAQAALADSPDPAVPAEPTDSPDTTAPVDSQNSPPPPGTDAARFSHPDWLCHELRAHWPQHFRQILAAGNRKPPLTLRVNRRKISRDAYLAELADAGIEATACADSRLGVTLDAALPVAQIPGFAAGRCSVQDESAQLAVAAAALQDGARVLDACAAPGGKTGALCEAHDLDLVALDLPPRDALIRENLTRLGAHAQVVAADLIATADTDTAGIDPTNQHHNQKFDTIILDAPCSGSGVIRRHPDIKHRRRAADIARFAGQQLALLLAAWRLLRGGGTLLYITCSVLPAENDSVVGQFLREQTTARVVPVAVPGIATRFGVQRLPGVHAGDGFYFCRLRRATAPPTPSQP